MSINMPHLNIDAEDYPAPSTFVDLLKRRARLRPDDTAYIFLSDGEQAEMKLTYAELDWQARAIAVLLQSFEARGKHVLLLYPPGLNYISAFFGCLYAGAIAVPVYPPRYNQHLARLQAIAENSEAEVALTTASVLSKVARSVADYPGWKRVQWQTSDDISTSLASEWQEPELSSDTLALLQYTSGSTSEPKGVMVTHGNLLHNQRMIQEAFGQSSKSVIMGWLPVYHDMGLIGNILQPLYLGAPCILMSPVSFLQSPIRWLKAISKYKATTSGGPNFAYELCVRKTLPDQRADLDLSSWTVAFNGAEPVSAETLDRFAETFEPYGFRRESFYPCYGMAEATLFISGGAQAKSPAVYAVKSSSLERNRVVAASPDEMDARRLVGCGHTWSDHEVAVVDPDSLKVCSPDSVGEIWVKGGSVAQGYWNQPEETERTFKAYLADLHGGPYLRTGDLGFLSEGQLFVTGRLKDLIIIRGRNYYPQDIEQTVGQAHKNLRPGCGAAFSVNVEGDERLVVVQEIDRQYKKADIEQVIGAIRQAVAEQHELRLHAIALIRPGAILKTSSNKIRRNACRSQFLEGSLDEIALWQEAAEIETDASQLYAYDDIRDARDVERLLISLLANRLRTSPHEIDVSRPLTYYGVDSLMAVELTHSLEEELKIVLPLTIFFQSAAISELAAQILARLNSSEANQVSQISQAEGMLSAHPLSYGQQALWFLQEVAPDSPAYNIASAARIRSELDISALRRAVQALAERHASLRASIAGSSEGPVQRIQEHVELFFEEVEGAATWTEALMSERLTDAARRSFDLEHEPLMRVHLFKRPAREYIMLLVVHHVVADFWSLAVLLRDLGLLYEREKEGRHNQLPPLRLQYADYVRWQNEIMEDEEGERLWAYWQHQLAGASTILSLPSARPRPPVQTYQGASYNFRIDAELTSKLKGSVRATDTTLFIVLLATFQVLLHRYTQQEDILVGSPTSGRSRAELAPLVGYFVNPVVLRASFSNTHTFETFLRQVRETVMAAFEYQDYPFALLVKRLQMEHDPSRSPLFQVMFTLQSATILNDKALGLFALGQEGARVEVGGLTLESVAFEQNVAQFDLSMAVAEADDSLAVSLQYNVDLFDKETIERTAGHFRTLLEGVTENPQTRICDLALLTRAEQQALREWNDTRTDYDEGVCIHHLIEWQVERSPDAVALVFEQSQITYAEMNERANQLAHYLKRMGVAPDVCVAACLDRSVEMMIGLIGILKAGGAYVPLDPGYPAERLEFMLRNSGALVLLTQESFAHLFSDHEARLLCLDNEWKAISEESRENPATPVTPLNSAYVIYTSGSTGKPKGVMVNHRNVSSFFVGMDERVRGSNAGTWLAVTSISFDISVLELFWTLARGFKVVLQHQEDENSHADSASRQVDKKMDFSLFYFATEEDEGAQGKYDLLFEGAKFADEHDFSAIWTPERHFHAFGGLYPSPSVTSAALAVLTKRVHIRAGSVVLPLHNPIRVAEEWALVDNFSKGRVGVSFASGWHTHDFVFAPESYASRREVMVRQIEIVRDLWRGQPVLFEDGSGNEIAITIRPRPVQHELPIWITAAGNVETFRLAGQMGANMLTHLLGQSLDELTEKIRVYREALRQHGHDPRQGKVTLMLHTFVERNLEVVREKVRKPFCDYLMSSIDLAKNLLTSLGHQIDKELTDDDLAALLSHAFDRYYETSGLFGTPTTCMPMINRLKQMDVDEIACLIDFGIDFDSVMTGLHYLDQLRQRSNVIRENVAREKEYYSPAEQIKRHMVTHMQCTPSLARLMGEDDEAIPAMSSLSHLLLGGEPLPSRFANQLLDDLTSSIENMYGPTETTIWSATNPVTRSEGIVSIGRPIANTSIHICDPRTQDCPVSIPGELLIGGAGVVRGYLGQPELTAERFIPDPFSIEPGARLYKTGDVASYRQDGAIDFIGRLDHQVKLRGYRVELAEIESVLRQHPSILDAAVMVAEGDGGDKRLVAYIVPAQQSAEASSHQTPLDGNHSAAEHRYTLPNGMAVDHHGSFQTSIIYKEIFVDEVYFKHGIALNEGDCIFDVGANVGLFSLYVHQHCRGAQIYAFEPIPASFSKLESNLAMQGVEAKLFECGVSSEPGTAMFTFYPNAAGLSGYSLNRGDDKQDTQSIVLDWLNRITPDGKQDILPRQDLDQLLEEYLQAETYTCRLITLSDVIRENNIDRIDLLKIDVERGEFDVLAGILNDDWRKIKQIVMEVHSKELLDEISLLLRGRGYEIAVDESFAVRQKLDGGGVFIYMLYAVHPSRKEQAYRSKSNGKQGQPAAITSGLVMEDLRRFLKEKLPDYMLPSEFRTLDAMPLTPNGKVDRKALPQTDSRRAGSAKRFAAPRNSIEKDLANIWAEILRVERVSINDNFFDVGGHSLMATQLVTRIRAKFSVNLTLRDFLRSSDIASMAEIIERELLENSSEAKIDELLDLLDGLEECEAQSMLGFDEPNS
jgi:natural product biosynthesis luciferase-like monooxygenase protein/FkbM family methyltransferase